MSDIFLNVITSAAILFIVSSGLLIISGVMKIINFSHGAFLTVGGYAGVITTYYDLSPLWMFPLALVLGFILGALVEKLVIQPLYRRPLDAILATWGLGIIIGQLITLEFGRETKFVPSPISGSMSFLGTAYSEYRLVLVIVAVVIALSLGLLLNGTRLGMQTRAVIMNESLARALGISSPRVRFLSFCIGSALASLAGSLITPLSSVDPNMGVPWLVSAFMLVLVSGSSLVSLAIACLVLGGAQTLISNMVSPILGGITLVVLAAVLLRVRPQGFAHE